MTKKKKIIITTIISLIVLIIMIVLYFFLRKSLAEYYDNDEWNYDTTSAKAYISSDLLTEDNAYILTISNYDYTNIPFKVYNFRSDSQISTRNIVYNINCVSHNSNYKCYVDNTSNYTVTNQMLNSSYQCSISTYSESQCAKDETATLTYNKKTNIHTIKVKKTSGSSANSVQVDIYLVVTSPFTKTLSRSLDLNFDNTNKSVKIETVGESDYQCEYLVSNYIDRGTLYLYTNDNTSYFLSNRNRSHVIELNIPKYTNKIVKIYKKRTTSCNGAIYSIYT